jgi:hypothetical protein
MYPVKVCKRWGRNEQVLSRSFPKAWLDPMNTRNMKQRGLNNFVNNVRLLYLTNRFGYTIVLQIGYRMNLVEYIS